MKSGFFKTQMTQILSASAFQGAEERLTQIKAFAIKSIASALVFALLAPDVARAAEADVRATGRIAHTSVKRVASSPDLLNGVSLGDLDRKEFKRKRRHSTDGSSGSEHSPTQDSSGTDPLSPGDSGTTVSSSPASTPEGGSSPQAGSPTGGGIPDGLSDTSLTPPMTGIGLALEAQGKRENVAAREIQRVWRGHKGRQEAEFEARIADLLEHVLIRYQERRDHILEKRTRAAELRRQAEEEEEERHRNNAAVLIQAHYKGHSTRTKFRAQQADLARLKEELLEAERLEAEEQARLAAAAKADLHDTLLLSPDAGDFSESGGESGQLTGASAGYSSSSDGRDRPHGPGTTAARPVPNPAPAERDPHLITPGGSQLLLDVTDPAIAPPRPFGGGIYDEEESAVPPARREGSAQGLRAFFKAPLPEVFVGNHATARPHTPAALHGSINHEHGFSLGNGSGSSDGVTEEAALLGGRSRSTYGAAAGFDLEAQPTSSSKQATARKLLHTLLESDPEASLQALNTWLQSRLEADADFLNRPFMDVLRELLDEYAALIPDQTARAIRARMAAHPELNGVTMAQWLSHYGLQLASDGVVETDPAINGGKAAAPTDDEHKACEGLRFALLSQVGEELIKKAMECITQRINVLDPNDSEDKSVIAFLNFKKHTTIQVAASGLIGVYIAYSVSRAMIPILNVGLRGVGRGFKQDVVLSTSGNLIFNIHTGLTLGVDALSRNISTLFELFSPSGSAFSVPIDSIHTRFGKVSKRFLVMLPVWLSASIAALLPVYYLWDSEKWNIHSNNPALRNSSIDLIEQCMLGIWLDALLTNVQPIRNLVYKFFTRNAIAQAFAGEAYTSLRRIRNAELQRLDELEGLFRFSPDIDIADWFEFVHTYGVGHLTRDPSSFDGAYEARETLRMISALKHIHVLNPYEEVEESSWKKTAVNILGWGIPVGATLGRALVFYTLLLGFFGPQHLVSKIFAALLGGGIASAFLGSVEVSTTKQGVRELLRVEEDEGGDTKEWKSLRRLGKGYNFIQGTWNTLPYILVGLVATSGWPLALRIITLSFFGTADMFNNTLSFHESYGNVFKAGRRLLSYKYVTTEEKRAWLLRLVWHFKKNLAIAKPGVIRKNYQ